MKKYQTPQIELDKIETEDIIMASLDNDQNDDNDLGIDN